MYLWRRDPGAGVFSKSTTRSHVQPVWGTAASATTDPAPSLSRWETEPREGKGLLKAPQGASPRLAGNLLSYWLFPIPLPPPRAQDQAGRRLRAVDACLPREHAHPSPGGARSWGTKRTLGPPQGTPRNVRPGREEAAPPGLGAGFREGGSARQHLS